ncbi:hypothetical protein PC129_g17013 [Phytophthora cactorum]|uniref:Uncharacterized protein n=1 Tax=Phytophthora cactorum TaxID=29920 RepID=A0A329RF05_9STRA|nr:hypothetical protein Pcac1_g2192 [Phytophthora cactorum]KAG2806283.1 hypothetical protein PC112_g17914 [Phytophthora cactorum]KAG2806699.1 hypothetical protein PC111_g17240 [Phytophthora cactorum]KAG2844962.1 hypothetical protein PC113_g18300 [Phytophthora cactorum]KAG2883977.1 hypothetical protein PC114_g20349 [Phytophthora cactorum]
MELLAFSPSDDGEDTDVLEYEDADSELADEDMRSTISSVENMDDDATISVEDMDDELLPRRTLLLEMLKVRIPIPLWRIKATAMTLVY